MLLWSLLLLRASYALAGVPSNAGAAAANMKEVYQLMHHHQRQLLESQDGHNAEHHDKLPTQPIHRSILSNRKRTFLNEKIASGSGEGNTNDNNALRTRDRRSSSENTTLLEKNEDQDEELLSQPNEEQHQQHQPPSEPTPPLLTSDFWVKVHEEVGQNSFNFVPESRRAASSVVFTYKHRKEERRLAEEGQGGELVDETNDTNDETTESSMQGIENDAGTVNNLSNATATQTQISANEEDAEVEKDSDEVKNVEGDGAPAQQTPETEKTNPAETSGGGEDEEEQYMIISGGYTDHDWKSFPVYAFPITSSITTESGQWIDLSPSLATDNVEKIKCNDEDGLTARDKLYQEAVFLDTQDPSGMEDPWESAQHCSPSGRMGHQSVIHDNKLYVFGGLIYDEEQGGNYRKDTFRLEDVPFVYRLDLNEMFEARRMESRGMETGDKKVVGWQRIVPRVTPFATPNGMSSTSAAEVLLTSVNRGEMQGGIWSWGGHDKLVIYGGLRIARLEYEGYGNNGPSKFMKGETTFGSNKGNYGEEKMRSHKIIEVPLGDVWAYDLVYDSWEKVTNDYGRGVKRSMGGDHDEREAEKGKAASSANGNGDEDEDDWWYDLDTSSYPRPRTAHAATVVGNELIIHGGMGWNEHTNDWDGSTDWETLDDMWILNLHTREWTRRWLFPLLVRSYHSLVGWSVNENTKGWEKDLENSTSWEGPVVAAFGGYTTGIDVFSGEELAYVFDDLLVSYPPPPKHTYDETPSPWLKATMNVNRDGAESISTRYEHSAVLSKEGVLVVWGGSFQDTSRVKGMWMINIAGEESSVTLSMAEADSIYNDYERTIGALHTIVIMLMFMSISLTLLLGLTQRYQELVQQSNDDAAVAAGMAFAAHDFGNDTPHIRRGNGLHPEIIDTIPTKTYSASENNGSDGEDREASNQECCPICLVEYQEGDDLRVLPCSHFMHRACLDAWLTNNPSCPSCRYSLSELVDDRPMLQLRTLRSRLSNNSALARFLGHDFVEGGFEMTNFGDGSLPRDAVIDLRYISSLALSEEDGAADSRGVAQSETGDGEDPTREMPAMEELSAWRSRRRQMRRGRGSRLSSLRQNVSRIRTQRRSRVPLADMDEE